MIDRRKPAVQILLTRFILTTGVVAGLLSATSAQAECTETPGLNHFFQQGWGIDYRSQRFQRETVVGAGNASRLKLKWAYGFGSNTPRVSPLVTEDTIFVGDAEVGLVALDRETGCRRWVNTMVLDPATAISHGTVNDKVVLVVAGRQSGIIAMDALTGETLWQRRVEDDNPLALFSGSPLVFENQVLVPISSMEIGLSVIPFYGCCTTSGALASLDLISGETNWYRRTIPDLPKVTGRHYVFVEEHGPSGAPVWGAPTLDVERRLVYFGTGQNYSHPASKTSDAIFAVDIDTGETRWVSQFTQGDAFNMACTFGGVNCPDPMGPDVDFGAPPILVTLPDGRDAVLAGQKSGDLWAIDPATGDTLWHTRIGRGGALGGIHWGMAVDPDTGLLFVPISDVAAFPGQEEAEPGMFALDISTGKKRWSAPRVQRCEGEHCWSGLSSAITAAPGVIVAGGLDGQLEVYHSESGDLLWSFDTRIEFSSTNGIATRGGSIDAHGPVIADNLIIAISGYDSFNQEPGNALLVFEVPMERRP